MAQFYNNFQKFGYEIPADGEVFINSNDPWKSQLFKRVGNTIQVFNVEEYAIKQDPNQKYNSGRGSVGWQSLGINPSSLPAYSGEAIQYFKTAQNNTDPSFFKDTSTDFTKGEIITQGLDPNNHSRLLTTSSLEGKTPPPADTSGELARIRSLTPAGGQGNTLTQTPAYQQSLASVPQTQNSSQQSTDSRLPSMQQSLDLGKQQLLDMQNQLSTSQKTEAPVPQNSAPGQGNAASKTGDPIKDAILKAAQDFLDKLANRGQVLNPNIEITPEKIAEFTAQAQRELSPYYQSQMKLARESLLKSVGYSIEDIGRNEQDLEKKYGTSLRTLGESAAEKGFALSGMRKRDEEQLAYETQQNIDLNRRTLGRQAESLASTYAQKYGGTDMPTSTISQAPRVLPGEINFQKSDAQNPFYTLSPETYQNLVGSQQYEQQTAEKTRVAGLKSDYKTDELSKRMRTLSL